TSTPSNRNPSAPNGPSGSLVMGSLPPTSPTALPGTGGSSGGGGGWAAAGGGSHCRVRAGDLRSLAGAGPFCRPSLRPPPAATRKGEQDVLRDRINAAFRPGIACHVDTAVDVLGHSLAEQ